MYPDKTLLRSLLCSLLCSLLRTSHESRLANPCYALTLQAQLKIIMLLIRFFCHLGMGHHRSIACHSPRSDKENTRSGQMTTRFSLYRWLSEETPTQDQLTRIDQLSYAQTRV